MVLYLGPLYSALIQGTTRPQMTDALEDSEGGFISDETFVIEMP